MVGYRMDLPQLGGDFFLTDGGIETTLIFHEGFVLPDFAAFHLLRGTAGLVALRKYFQTYTELSRRLGVGLILESATWRASTDWAARLGYTRQELAEANRVSIRLLAEIRSNAASGPPIVISGCIGPRGRSLCARTNLASCRVTFARALSRSASSAPPSSTKSARRTVPS